jgi:hypothetical protein
VQPEEHRSQAGLEAMVASGPFRGQLEAFGAALQAGQLDLSQFGLQAEARAPAHVRPRTRLVDVGSEPGSSWAMSHWLTAPARRRELLSWLRERSVCSRMLCAAAGWGQRSDTLHDSAADARSTTHG